MTAQFPDKLDFLFKSFRYKVAYGGRGAAKSWGFARALLIIAAHKPTRVLCAREIQKSIKQSVHTLLTDQIQDLGLGHIYSVTESEIRGKNGSLFSFCGLATHTVESIKSYEGTDIVWVEEAQTVGARSWDILIPTIRRPGSEIWISLNPDLDSDDTYVRFIENQPPDSCVVKINWSDNPWFPDVLEQERLHCQTTRPKDYSNIWEGQCKTVVDGAIYADEIIQMIESKRICNVPYDPALKVHAVFDLGWNDLMTISLVQVLRSEVRIIEYIEGSHQTLDHYSGILRNKLYNWGSLWLPHDGEAKDYKTGKSAQQIMQELGWTVEIVPRGDIEQGIKNARRTLPRTYIDQTRAKGIVNRLKRYRRQINQTTNEPGAPLHDENSHGADNYRYIATACERMTNDSYTDKPIKYPGLGIV